MLRRHWRCFVQRITHCVTRTASRILGTPADALGSAIRLHFGIAEHFAQTLLYGAHDLVAEAFNAIFIHDVFSCVE